MSIDLTITMGHLITLVGYLVLALGVYYGIKIDLARMEERRITDKDACSRAQSTADEAHSKLNEHVITFHAYKSKG